jgi:hypothetical protein
MIETNYLSVVFESISCSPSIMKNCHHLVRKDMVVNEAITLEGVRLYNGRRNEHERLSNITLRHKVI